MKKAVLVFVAALVIGFAAFLYVRNENVPEAANIKDIEPQIDISIKGAPFKAIVRDTPTTRAMGLSGRESLKENDAMLFAFPNVGTWGIWMKDMKFSIDILWLDRDRAIVHIEKNVSPESYPTIFFPKSESLYVIELGAGIVDKIGASVGDKILFAQEVPVGK